MSSSMKFHNPSLLLDLLVGGRTLIESDVQQEVDLELAEGIGT